MHNAGETKNETKRKKVAQREEIPDGSEGL